MAVTNSIRRIPRTGDVVKDVDISYNEDGEPDMAEVYFENGKSITLHLYVPT